MTWTKLFDWICGVIIVLYIIGVLVQVLLVVIMEMVLWKQVVTILPFVLSVVYVIWRLIEKGRTKSR